jgi:hypothetical protein
MHNVLWLSGLVACLCLSELALADTWGPPIASTFFSEDGSHEVLVSRSRAEASLTVSARNPAKTNELWNAKCPNIPVTAYVSNNGSNVVTIDSWFQSGYGDAVVVVYSPQGILNKHRLEDFAPPPSGNQPFGRPGYEGLFPISTSSRHWISDSFMLFSPQRNPSYFCVWLPWFGKWVGFDLRNGAVADVSGKILSDVNAQAEIVARPELLDAAERFEWAVSMRQVRALKFLVLTKAADSKKLLENALQSEVFRVGYGAINDRPALLASSEIRDTADALLAEIDGSRLAQERERQSQGIVRYGFGRPNPMKLGTLKGNIKFSRSLRQGDSYQLSLVSVSPGGKNHTFRIGKDEDPTQSYIPVRDVLDFELRSLLPGTYQLKIKGDFSSTDEKQVSVVAGESSGNIEIRCTHKRK